jgi:hypothetical protein
MNWITIAATYISLGILISLLFLIFEIIYNGSRLEKSEYIGRMLLWPFVLKDIPALMKNALNRKRASHITPLSSRITVIEEYLEDLKKSKKINSQQIDLILKSYDWFFENGRHLHPKTDEERRSRWGYEISDVSLFDTIASSGNQSLVESSQEWLEERRRSIENTRRSGALGPLFSNNCNIAVSPFFEDTAKSIKQDRVLATINAIKGIARKTKGIGASEYSLNEIYSEVKMNGPLPCLIISHKIALIIEPESGQFCLMGIISSS